MSQQSIRCEVCGKVIVPTKDTAGTKMRCECGHLINVPDFEAGPTKEYEFVEEWNPDPAAKPKPKVTRRPPPPPEMEEAPTYPSRKKDTVAGRYGPRKKVDFRKRGEADQEVQRVMHETAGRWLMTLSIVGVVILGVIGWVIKHQPSTLPLPSMRPDDQVVIDEMQESGSTEAVAWLKAGKRHAVPGWNNEQALAHVKDWYALGAVKVLAFGEAVSGSLVIELPSDPKKRMALFAWADDYAASTHQKSVADSGQKYLIIELKF